MKYIFTCSLSIHLLPQRAHASNCPHKAYINLELYMRNLTRQPGARAMFYCDILGQPIPQFQWFKDGKLLTEQPNRIRIETGLWGSS